jgi:hypothetical protein
MMWLFFFATVAIVGHHEAVHAFPAMSEHGSIPQPYHHHHGHRKSRSRLLWMEDTGENFVGFGQSFLRKLNTVLSEEESKAAAPVYITIGPPCAGKTNALRLHLEQDGYDPNVVLTSFTDVALDEQSNVYQRVPLASFLFPSSRLEPKLGDKVLGSGITLRDRLLDQQDRTDIELRNVILRVAGRMTPQEFADRTREQALQHADTVKFFRERRIQIAEDLIMAVEQVSVQAVGELLYQMQATKTDALTTTANDDDDDDVGVNELPYHEDEATTRSSEQASVVSLTADTVNATSAHLLSARALIGTPYVDIFVPHAIFGGGIDRAESQLQELLSKLSPTTPVSWGNTNTRPVEYVAALRAAQLAGRPVQFVAWGCSPYFPRVPCHELLRRAVSKFRNTGRYIPAGAIGASLGRVEWLVREAEKEVIKLKWEPMDAATNADRKGWAEDGTEVVRCHKMNVAFAALAGFVMNDEGRVVKVGEPKTPNQKFRVKKKRNRKEAEAWDNNDKVQAEG